MSLCSQAQNKQIIDENKCLPGFVLIDYRGEVNHPVKSILLRTDSNDNNYQKHELSNASNRKYLLKDIIIKNNEYEKIKEYVINNRRQNSRTCLFQITIIDKCDSIYYTIDKKDNKYFNELLNVNILNDEFEKYINSYIRIQKEYRSKK